MPRNHCMLQIPAAIKILRRSNAACCECGWGGLPAVSSLVLILAAVISRNTVGPVDGRLEREWRPRHQHWATSCPHAVNHRDRGRGMSQELRILTDLKQPRLGLLH
jgi:hypothetical protein